MAKKDPRVDAYIDNAPEFAQPILRHFRKVVHAACPGVEETIKWRFPTFEFHGILGGIAAFKASCGLMFWKGELLKQDVLSAADAAAIEKVGRVTAMSDVPSQAVLTRVIKAAAAADEQGLKAPRMRRQPKKPLRVPPYFSAALKKNAKAKAAFDAFSPSHKREYIEWITGAKTAETRQRRLDQAVVWIGEGKGRNWKYERPRT